MIGLAAESRQDVETITNRWRKLSRTRRKKYVSSRLWKFGTKKSPISLGNVLVVLKNCPIRGIDDNGSQGVVKLFPVDEAILPEA